MKRLLVVIVCMGFLSPGPIRAAENPFNVDCFVGWNGCFRPGTWTPLEIGITSSLTENFAGRVHVSVIQDSVNRMNITQPFVLTVDQPTHIPLVTKIAFGADELNLRLTDAKGRAVRRLDIGLFDFSRNNRMLKPVNREDLFIGSVGRQRFGLLRLPEKTQCMYTGQSNSNLGQVFVESKLPHMVPWDWTGFTGLDLLILYDPDWGRFRNEQVKAITDWVERGGKLLVVLGTFPFPGNSLLGQKLPVTIGALKEVAVSTAWLNRWSLDAASEERAVCYALTARADARVYTPTDTNEPTLFAGAQLGFGRVGVLGLDPSTLDEAQRDRAPQFWVHAFNQLLANRPGQPVSANRRNRRVSRSGNLQAATGKGAREHRSIRLAQAESVPESPNRNNRFSYDMGATQQGTSNVLDYLAGIQEMRPLSIGWVILLLLLLAVLLGPVDYMVLKRLDRQPLTWVTSIFWITLFTVGAYYGVQALRAGDMQLRTVSVVDGIQDQGPGWTSQVCGLFAPKSADYALDQLQPGQWWSSVAPSRGHVSAYQMRSSHRNLYCAQSDGGNLPYSMPINIWTMQTLAMESRYETLPIQARLALHEDSASLEITNNANCAIEQGVLLLESSQGLRIPRIEAGQTRRVDGTLKGIYEWQGIHSRTSGAWSKSLDPADAFDLIGTQTRSQGIRDYLHQGAAVVCVQFSEAPTPVTVKDRSSKYHHQQFARLVVFPE
jgi:hypothetical protein